MLSSIASVYELSGFLGSKRLFSYEKQQRILNTVWELGCREHNWNAWQIIKNAGGGCGNVVESSRLETSRYDSLLQKVDSTYPKWVGSSNFGVDSTHRKLCREVQNVVVSRYNVLYLPEV